MDHDDHRARRGMGPRHLVLPADSQGSGDRKGATRIWTVIAPLLPCPRHR
jgi:hypothetical protein